MSLEKELFRKKETVLRQTQEVVPDFLKPENEEEAEEGKEKGVIDEEGGEKGKVEGEDDGELKEGGEEGEEAGGKEGETEGKGGGEEEAAKKDGEMNEKIGLGGKEGVKRQISIKMKKTLKFSQADFLSRLELGNLKDENDLDNQRFMAFDGFIGPISTSFNFLL